MKKTSIITISVLAMTLCASCDNLLNLESETSVTTNYLKTDKDGLKRAIAGLMSMKGTTLLTIPIQRAL